MIESIQTEEQLQAFVQRVVDGSALGARLRDVAGRQTQTLIEQDADLAAPDTGQVILYAKDNGLGKLAVYARFATGAPQQVALEP